MSAIRRFELDAETYFERVLPAEQRDVQKEAMEQIIERYRLRGRSVLSLGPGLGMQEYWLHKAGCRITCLDIDEHNSLTSAFDLALAGEPPPNRPLTYYLGDISDVQPTLPEGFETLFVSGFTPDEMWRERKMNRLGPLGRILREWPRDEPPLSDAVAKTIAENLLPNGLFIKLSYYSGPNVYLSKNYLDALRRQCSKLGLALIEVLHLRKAPAVNLTVAIKADEREAARYGAVVRNAAPISVLHPRSPLAQTTDRTYAIWSGAEQASGTARLRAKLRVVIGAILSRILQR